MHRRLHLWPKDDRAPFAGAVAWMQGDVVVADAGAGRVAARHRHPDARVHDEVYGLSRAQHERLGQHSLQALRDQLRPSVEVLAFDEDQELVPAQPSNGVTRPDRSTQPGADRAQELVANLVAEAVVDVLEIIEVDI